MMTEFKIDSQGHSVEAQSPDWSDIASGIWAETKPYSGNERSSVASISEASHLIPPLELVGLFSDTNCPEQSEDGSCSSDPIELDEKEESIDDEISRKYIEELKTNAASLLRELALAIIYGDLIGPDTTDPHTLDKIREKTIKQLDTTKNEPQSDNHKESSMRSEFQKKFLKDQVENLKTGIATSLNDQVVDLVVNDTLKDLETKFKIEKILKNLIDKQD